MISDDKVYLQEDFLQCLAVEMELGELVNLPSGVLLQEWIASHTVSFFEHINGIYGTISEFCTMSGCSEMIGPNNKVYFWSDERGKRSKVPAPQYIDYVMTYMQKTLNDASIFPTKADKEFPSSFEVYARKIYRLLFHVLAHIYQSHFNEIVILDLHKHLNCIYVHLILFNQQFNLIEPKELEALNDLSVALKLVPDNQPEQMQIASSTTPEPPGSIDPYLESSGSSSIREPPLATDQQPAASHTHPHLELLQSSNSFNQENQHQQRKKHSRQHSYTANQTISSPTTNYIKRFISSLSPSNQTTASSQSCAINEENSLNSLNSLTGQAPSNSVITTQSKSPFSIRNELEQNELLNSSIANQENQHSEQFASSNKKVVLSNFSSGNKRTDVDGKAPADSFGASSGNNPSSKIHKYQHSTPIFFGSSFFTSRTKTASSQASGGDKATAAAGDASDVQFNEKVIKENTKLLNSDQTDDEYAARLSSSASAIYLQPAGSAATSSANFSAGHPMGGHLTESEDYSLDDQSLMSCNPTAHLRDSNPTLDQMETSSSFDRHAFGRHADEADLDEPEEDGEEEEEKPFAANRTFGSLEIEADDDEFENAGSSQGSNSHRTASNNRRDVLVDR